MSVHQVEWHGQEHADQEAVRQKMINRPVAKQALGRNGPPEQRGREEQVQVAERPAAAHVGVKERLAVVGQDPVQNLEVDGGAKERAVKDHDEDLARGHFHIVAQFEPLGEVEALVEGHVAVALEDRVAELVAS